MITCRQVVELLIDFVTGELPDDHRALVEKHMEMCPPCVAFVESYRLTIQLTRRLPPAKMPQSLHDRLVACLREIERQKGCGREGDGG
jgi:anti-sigma factor RsiW